MSKKPTSLISDLQRAKIKRNQAVKDVRNNLVRAQFGHEKAMTVSEKLNHVRVNSKDYHDLCDKLK